jgi:uncharacterized protein
MLTRVLAGLIVAFMSSGVAVAGPFEDGFAAYKRGDYTTALTLWRPLAEQGLAAAQFNLGFIYDKGHGVPQDYTEAAKWYRLAADQGDVFSQTRLGFMYEAGRGVLQDPVQAYMWLSLVAFQGDAVAFERRNFIDKHMTPDQIAEAQKLVREWKPTPAQ